MVWLAGAWRKDLPTATEPKIRPDDCIVVLGHLCRVGSVSG